MKKINFKQPKYMIPIIIYFPLLFVGYMVIDMFNIDTSTPSDTHLKTTNYLSSELPEAYTDSVLGSKMENTQKEFGKITDLSGVQNVADDRDSLLKKESYDSKYSEDEARKVRQQQAEEAKKLEAMQDRVRQNRKSITDDDYVAPVSDSDIAKVQRMRRQNKWSEIERNLSGNDNDTYIADSDSQSRRRNSSGSNGEESSSENNDNRSSSNGTSNRSTDGNTSSSEVKEQQPEKVVKKTKETSEYFNTIEANSGQSKLISAIIDEDVKAVDGSRVRLRLLDDIQIGDKTVGKGTYIYAIMSGFGKQRVNGKIESIFYNEDIMKVDLSIYDTDGLPGLYVPLSTFRETTKDIASSAMQGGNILDNNSTSSNGIKGWASQAAQNASQRVMNALGTAAKKNRVKLKYGTKVYLIDESKNK